MLHAEGYSVAWRQPFGAGGEVFRDVRAHGQSIAEIVASVPCLHPLFATRGVVCINGEPIPRAFWAHVRPKTGNRLQPVAVTLHLPLAGGGNGGKSILTLVASIALIAVTQGIASGAILGGLTGAAAAGGATFASSVLAGAVGLVGALAISALTPPPSVPKTDTSSSTEDNTASLSGNVLAKGTPLPRVIGTHKVFPPLAGDAIVSIVDDDEYVEALYCLAGPHALSDIRINDNPIENDDSIEYEVREGWEGDSEVGITPRQGKVTLPNLELSTVDIDPTDSDANTIRNQTNPDVSKPTWHTFNSRNEQDELHLHLYANEGIYDSGATNTRVFIPFRIRFRQKGAASWTNGPEFHVAGKMATRFKFDLQLLWQNAPGGLATPPTNRGVIRAYTTVPAQSSPAQHGWQAAAYFGGTTSGYVENGNFSGNDVINIELGANFARIYLAPATFPKGRYEVQLMCGAAVLTTAFTASSYNISSTVRNLFGYWLDSGTYRPATYQDKGRKLTVSRVIAIWNEHPVAKSGLALIAVKAKNQSINSLSVVASGYVQDWDGYSWGNWTTTSNPAPHYRDVLSGAANMDPLPDEIRADDWFVDWRADCASNGYTCDTVIEGGRIEDTLSLIAACGYARPYQSELWGVVLDNDKSAETPVQIFSARNSANFRWEKAFARAPNAFRVTYKDASLDYEDTEIIVYPEGYSPSSSDRFEDVTYGGIVDEDRAIVRARFDLMQPSARGIFYRHDTAPEHIVCRKGSLVGMHHDVLQAHAGSARIAGLVLSGSDITHIDLDCSIEVAGGPDMLETPDMLEVDDLLEVGLRTGIAIRRTDGTISTHAIANGPGLCSRLELSTPIPQSTVAILTGRGMKTYDAIGEGNLVVSGLLGAEYSRMIVLDITMTSDQSASLTLVDEAPQLVRTP